MIYDITGCRGLAGRVAVDAGEAIPGQKQIEGSSPWQLAWERLRKDRAAMIAWPRSL